MNEQLQRLIHSIKQMGEAEELLPLPAKIDLLLYAPCPIKLVMKDHIDRIVRSYQERNVEVGVHIPMGCTSIDPYDPIYQETDPGKLPAIIASIGFGDFWKKEFVDRFVRSGFFEAALPSPINPMYEQAEMIDPRGCYTIYGVTPYIFLVDTRRLGPLPMPRTWEDLLDPRYRNEIVMCGDGDDMADAVVLNLYKEQGIDGLKRLAGNVKNFMHSSKMAKIAGTNDPEAAAIFIIPVFFAESTKRPAYIQAVWPEDGAAASPLYFLAQKREKARLADLISFFTQSFATIESASWFVPLGGSDLSGLPRNAKLKWVGWKFIAENDVNSLRDELNALFRAATKGTPMRLVTVAGPPSCGKTSLIVKTCGHLMAAGTSSAVVKFDCLQSRDDTLYLAANIPVTVALSGGLCPDHFLATNLEEAFSWAQESGSECCIIETAGLCNRCSPHIRGLLALCVIDNLMGIEAPEKIGPMLRMADVVAITKGDLVSQAEREVYRHRIRQMNRRAVIRHVNGLTGQGCMDLAAIVAEAPAIESVTDMKLRFSMPAAVCSYCLSEMRLGSSYQKGNVKKARF